MHWEFRISQRAIVENDLLGKVPIEAFLLLHYLKGWTDLDKDKAERISIGDREYVWILYKHAVSENPLLFSPKAGVRTNENRMIMLMRKLRGVGLVETVKHKSRLYFFLPPLAQRLFFQRRQKTGTENRVTSNTKERVTRDTENRVGKTALHID